MDVCLYRRLDNLTNPSSIDSFIRDVASIDTSTAASGASFADNSEHVESDTAHASDAEQTSSSAQPDAMQCEDSDLKDSKDLADGNPRQPDQVLAGTAVLESDLPGARSADPEAVFCPRSESVKTRAFRSASPQLSFESENQLVGLRRGDTAVVEWIQYNWPTLAFPFQFPFGVGTIANPKRRVPMSPQSWAKRELRSADPDLWQHHSFPGVL
jgi:hypothetical protein